MAPAGTCWRGRTESREASGLRQWPAPLDSAGGECPAPSRVHRAESPGRKPEIASARRRMRAVTGSSAEDCFCRARCGVASMLWAAFSALIRSASSETLGRAFAAWLRRLAGKPGLELVAQGGQFGQIGVVEEGLAQAGLVVAKLGFGDGEVLPDAVAFGAVAVGQAFQGVQDGTRPLVVARERGLARRWHLPGTLPAATCGCSTRPKRRPR